MLFSLSCKSRVVSWFKVSILTSDTDHCPLIKWSIYFTKHLSNERKYKSSGDITDSILDSYYNRKRDEVLGNKERKKMNND